jgi:hypothetical protein
MSAVNAPRSRLAALLLVGLTGSIAGVAEAPEYYFCV